MDKISNPLFASTDESGQQYVMLNVDGGQEVSGGQYVMDAEGNIHYIMMEEGEDQTNEEAAAVAPTEGEFYLDEAMAAATLANGGQIEINGVLYQLQTSGDDANTMMIDMSVMPTEQQPLFTDQVNSETLSQLEKKTEDDIIFKSSDMPTELPELNESNISTRLEAERNMLTDKETTDLSEFLDIKSTLNDISTIESSTMQSQTNDPVINDNDDNSPDLIKYIQVPSRKDGQPINIQISTDKNNLSHKVIILPMNNDNTDNTGTIATAPKFNVISKSQLLLKDDTKSQEKDIMEAKSKMITFERLKSEYKYYPKTKKGFDSNSQNPNEQRIFRSQKRIDSLDDNSDDDNYAKHKRAKQIQGKEGNYRTLPKGSKIIMNSNKFSGVLNKALMCRPAMATKATSCNPIKVAKITQTDLSDEEEKICIPVPFPMCVPTPVFEGIAPVPQIIPIALPIPVPLYTPMSKEAVSASLIKLKELYDSLPSDEETNMKQQEGTAEVLKKIAIDEGFEDCFSQEIKELDVACTNSKEDGNFDADIQAMDNLIDKDEQKNIGNIRTDNINVSNNANNTISNKQSLRNEMNFYIPPAIVRRVPINSTGMNLKYSYGINAWRQWVAAKNIQISASFSEQSFPIKLIPRDPLHIPPHLLNEYLSLFVKEIIKPTGDPYSNDSIYYFCLGIQHYLYENGRFDNIFYDATYRKFIVALHEILNDYQVKINDKGLIVCRITEEHLWESRQLGVHSPHVLLNTLMYFNTRYYMLTTVDDHKAISFANVMKQWKKIGSSPILGRPPQKSVYLKYSQTNTLQKNNSDHPCEQFENPENPHRCPVKIYEFYLLKCPESIKNRYDVFYMMPEPSCIPESPVWFSTQALGHIDIEEMLTRVKIIKEILEIQMNNLPPQLTFI